VIGALFLTGFASAAGIVATYGFDPRAPGYARIATGMVIGLTTLAFAAFILALVIGLGPVTLIGASAVTALLAVRLVDPNTRRILRDDLRRAQSRLGDRGRRPTRGDAWLALYVAAIAVGVWMVADRNLFQTADGLYITNVGNLGDLPFHTAITASFAYGHNFPPQNPAASGIAFSYYYIVDFIAAMFVVAGTTLRDGMLVMTLIGGGCLMAVVHRWARDITGNPAVARLTPLLLVFSGGLGWYRLFQEAQHNGTGLIGAYLGTDIRFTIESEGLLRFQNAVTGFLVPQRGILLGMSIAVIVFTLMWQQLTSEEQAGAPTVNSDRSAGRRNAGVVPASWRWLVNPRMTVAGVLTGILPMVHIHTFAVVLGTAFLLAVLFRQWREGRWRAWVAYLAGTAVVALPVLAWTARGNAAAIGSYFGVQFGWELGDHDFLTFWLANTGLFIPLLLVAFLWMGDKPLLSRRLVLYSLPFMVWFPVANVFRLAPWSWDNIKVLAYWWLGGAPVVAILLVALWDRGRTTRILSVALAVVLVAAGALDVARSTIGPNVYQLWSTEGIAFADAVRQRTPPNAIILTDPTWNTPILLTGRPLYMGYDGWLFAHGLPYAEREQQAKAMFAGGEDAARLLRDTHVAYIELGPQERSDVSPNESFLSQFPVAVEVGEYRLYEVAGL
jgi:hypothetical protein